MHVIIVIVLVKRKSLTLYICSISYFTDKKVNSNVIPGGQCQNWQYHYARCHNTNIDTDLHKINCSALRCFLPKVEDSRQWYLQCMTESCWSCQHFISPICIPFLFIFCALCGTKYIYDLLGLDDLKKKK